MSPWIRSRRDPQQLKGAWSADDGPLRPQIRGAKSESGTSAADPCNKNDIGSCAGATRSLGSCGLAPCVRRMSASGSAIFWLASTPRTSVTCGIGADMVSQSLIRDCAGLLIQWDGSPAKYDFMKSGFASPDPGLVRRLQCPRADFTSVSIAGAAAVCRPLGRFLSRPLPGGEFPEQPREAATWRGLGPAGGGGWWRGRPMPMAEMIMIAPTELFGRWILRRPEPTRRFNWLRAATSDGARKSCCSKKRWLSVQSITTWMQTRRLACQTIAKQNIPERARWQKYRNGPEHWFRTGGSMAKFLGLSLTYLVLWETALCKWAI